MRTSKKAQEQARLQSLENIGRIEELKNKVSHYRLVSAFFICLFLGSIATLIITDIAQSKIIKQLPPANLGATYYDAHGSAWVRFDLTDQRQTALVKVIENTCKQYNMSNCMNALDRLGVR